MSTGRRAFLYVTRKRGKTLTIFLILLVITTMTLSGAAIKDAANTAQLNVREALGGCFTLTQNTSDPTKWVQQKVGDFGYQQYYNGEKLTQELADGIVARVDGIKGYNASCNASFVATRPDGRYLDLIETGQEDDFSSYISGLGDFIKTVTTMGCSHTEFDSYFANGFIKLTDGRHITGNDTNAALVGKELAEQNGISIGDKLFVQRSQQSASSRGVTVEETRTEVEIVGFFEVNGKASVMLSNWAMDNALFTTFDVMAHVSSTIAAEGNTQIDFYASDPAELGRIIRDVMNLDGIDPTDFVVRSDTSGIDAVSKPLKNINNLMTTLMVIIIVIGVAVLYLVLASRVKERVHECGVLLSIGISKVSIALQYLTELAMIAVLAFGLSYACSGLVAQNVGDMVLDYGLSDTAEDTGINSNGGMSTINSNDLAPKFNAQSDLTAIHVTIGTSVFAVVCLAGLLLIILSVSLAVIPIVRLKPKEILSKMS